MRKTQRALVQVLRQPSVMRRWVSWFLALLKDSFNDGYLINVKLPNSNINLRGAIFLPGRSIPITVENDVAPQIPMINRVEIDITSLEPQTKLYSSVSLAEQSVRAPAELNDKACGLLSEDKAADPQPGIPSSREKEPTSIMLPLVDSTQCQTLKFLSKTPVWKNGQIPMLE